jgi:hypothetical protein
MSASDEKRIPDLQTVLAWEGEITNTRIRELLDIKMVQASRTLAGLLEYVGDCWSRPHTNGPVQFHHSAIADTRGSPDHYLLAINRLSKAGTNLDALGIYDARIDLSLISQKIFASIVQAIRRKEGLEICYRSMTHPKGQTRIVFPHAIVRAPRRWHMRAWCTQRQEFRDFVLGRMLSATPLNVATPQSQEQDSDWNGLEEMVIIPHPDLSPDQQDMIAEEFFPGSRSLRLRIRKCLKLYVIQDLQLATDPERDLPPQYQLCLVGAS